MNNPYKITVVASTSVNMTNHTAAVEKLPVVNSGTKPLRITVRVADVTRFSREYPAASWVKEIRPAVFTLGPGKTEWVTVRIVPPAGARGVHAFNFMAAAAPAAHAPATGVSGTLGIGGGGTIRVIEPGHATAMHVAPPPPAPVIPASPSSFPLAATLGLAAILACLIIAGAIVWRQHRHPKGSHQQ